jgi:hypothetical protein
MAGEEDDLRSALEEAYDAQEGETETPSPEAGGSDKDTSQPVRDTTPTEESERVDKPADKPEATDEATKPVKKGKEETPPERKQDSSTQFKAPESWKPQARDAWAKVPAEAQQEILRRERDIVQTLQATSVQRKLAADFFSAVSPFEMMIRSEGSDPISATRELFGQAAILRIGTPAQKAQLVANVVKRFNVPIQDLDAALVGEQIPDEEGKIAQILEKQLAPVRQFMSTIDQTRQQRTQQVDGQIDGEIEAFAEDKANEFFFDVKEEMADLMEMAAKRNQSMTLKQAYDKAIQLNPEIAKAIQQRNQDQVTKARAAGSSLPSRGAPVQSGQHGDDLRSDIMAAFDSVANR